MIATPHWPNIFRQVVFDEVDLKGVVPENSKYLNSISYPEEDIPTIESLVGGKL